MSVQLIQNRLTDERGYQARWKGKTKYFSCRIAGDRAAKAQAVAAEQAMMAMVPSTGGIRKRGCDNHFSLSRTSAGPNGLMFLWKEYSGGTRYPVIRGHYKEKGGHLNNSECSINRHGVYGACLQIHQRKMDMGFPCLPAVELADIVLKWLKETWLQHPNNLPIHDIMDIDEQGNLRMQHLETKTIMVVGVTIPTVTVLKQHDTFYRINWVTPKKDTLHRALDAIKHDHEGSSKAQRMEAAEQLMLVALGVEADGYFVPVSSCLEAVVSRVFKANDLPVVACSKTEEHGYTMLFK